MGAVLGDVSSGLGRMWQQTFSSQMRAACACVCSLLMPVWAYACSVYCTVFSTLLCPRMNRKVTNAVQHDEESAVPCALDSTRLQLHLQREV